jgi:4-diphosphocytidyl-2-C-methyl-D-erythritol kinase
MVNVLTSLADEVRIRLVDKGIRVQCHEDPQVPNGEANIAYRACKEILAYSNKNIGVDIAIVKKVPSAAGLGGGSSNAATVLVGLNQMLKIGLGKDKLVRIGAKLGADVPFFIFGSNAIATGIGEKLQKIKSIPKMNVVIVVPRIAVSSAWAYGDYRGEPRTELEEIPNVYRTKKAVQKIMMNDLEKVTEKRYPIVAKIKEVFLKKSALAAQMSGSGPSVFGIFPGKVEAEKAYASIRDKFGNWRCYLVETM